MQQEGTIRCPPEVLRAATPFGSGIGGAREMCGALVGAVMAIGLRQGRTDWREGNTGAYWPAGYLVSTFRGRFGATACAVLTGGFEGFETPERRAHCASTIVPFCAARAQEILEVWR